MSAISVSKNQVSRRQMLHWLGIASAAALLPEMAPSDLEPLPIVNATTLQEANSYLKFSPIVLTDDNDFGRGMTKVFLETIGGFQIIDTPSALEALSICHNQSVSLVICDYLRPDMNGREVLRRLRSDSTTAHIPFMLCTGLVNPWDEAELDVDCLLYKPADPNELIVNVQRLLENGRL